MKNILLTLLTALSLQAGAQQIQGAILEKTENGTVPVPGAIVKWVSNPQNPTTTDMDG